MPSQPASAVARVRRLSFSLCAAVIAINGLLSIVTPTTSGVDDDINQLDATWRVSQGQHRGTDFLDPMGLGLPQLSAVAWKWWGARYWLYRLTVILFGITVVAAASAVATRRFGAGPGCGAIFLVAVAVLVSAPSCFGFPPYLIGLAEIFNRLSVSALAVLLVHLLVPDPRGVDHSNAFDVVITTWLLNTLFLLKISALVIGLGFLLAYGVVDAEQWRRRCRHVAAAVALFLLAAWIEFTWCGLRIGPVFREYAVAASARTADLPRNLVHAVFNASTLISVSLLAIYAASARRNRPGASPWSLTIVVLTYCSAQVALNLANANGPVVALAPAAALVILARTNSISGARWDHVHEWLSASSLRQMSARAAIPPALLLMVLVPEIASSIAALSIDGLVTTGVLRPQTITSGRRLGIRTLNFFADNDTYAEEINNGSRALLELGLDRRSIATLDYANPFPALLEARSPRGAYVWVDPGSNVLLNAKLTVAEVLGDATVVMAPKHPDLPAAASMMTEAARATLADDFEIVREDDSWTIYRRRRPLSVQ